MKRITLLSTVALLVLTTLLACRKTTRGKMEGEWIIDNMVDKKTIFNSANSIYVNEIKIQETAISMITINNSDSMCYSGTIQEATCSIKKNGTWTRTIKFTTTRDSPDVHYTTVSSRISSGNWDFAKGVGEFKRNERVLFSTLYETRTDVTTGDNGFFSNFTSTKTYADGESNTIYVVTDSKKKSLKLALDGYQTSDSGNNVSSEFRDITIELSAK